MWASVVSYNLDLQKIRFWTMKFAIQTSSLGSNRFSNSSHFCRSYERLADSLKSQSKSNLWTWVFGSDAFQTMLTSYSGTTCSETRSDFGFWTISCTTAGGKGKEAGMLFFEMLIKVKIINQTLFFKLSFSVFKSVIWVISCLITALY